MAFAFKFIPFEMDCEVSTLAVSLQDMSLVMGKNREELLAMARGLGETSKGYSTLGEVTMKEVSPFSTGIKYSQLLHHNHPEAKGLLNKSLFKYDQLRFIFSKDRATGKAAEAPVDAIEDLDREEGTIGLDDMDDVYVPMITSTTQSTGTEPTKRRRTRDSSLKSSTISNSLIRVNAPAKLLSMEEILQKLLHFGNSSRTPYKNDFVNAALIHLGILQTTLNMPDAVPKQIHVDLLKSGTGEACAEINAIN
ncbi:hypothetical protein RJ640_022538 [Escallonia rubra]|uniref:Uncharacterized protein n=1 Tax=Escallonia rubra TaxID=112253 RepID=A0AA88RMH7_9ASTE|nr:hypothetical protein RJ640_022538 [Escallonia rubra]